MSSYIPDSSTETPSRATHSSTFTAESISEIHRNATTASYLPRLLSTSTSDLIFLKDKHFRSAIWKGGKVTTTKTKMYTVNVGYVNRKNITCYLGLPPPLRSSINATKQTISKESVESSPRQLFWSILLALDLAFTRSEVSFNHIFCRDGSEEVLWLLFLLIQTSCDLLLRRHCGFIDPKLCEENERQEEKVNEDFMDDILINVLPKNEQQKERKKKPKKSTKAKSYNQKRNGNRQADTHLIHEFLEKAEKTEKKDTFWVHGMTYTAVLCLRLLSYQLDWHRVFKENFIQEFTFWILSFFKRLYSLECNESSPTTPFISLIVAEIDSVFTILFPFTDINPTELFTLYRSWYAQPSIETAHLLSVLIRKCYATPKIVCLFVSSLGENSVVDDFLKNTKLLQNIEDLIIKSEECQTNTMPSIRRKLNDWRKNTFLFPWHEQSHSRLISFEYNARKRSISFEYDSSNHKWVEVCPASPEAHLYHLWLAIFISLTDSPLKRCRSRAIVHGLLTSSLAHLLNVCVTKRGHRCVWVVRMVVDLCALCYWNFVTHDDSYATTDFCASMCHLLSTYSYERIAEVGSGVLLDAFLHCQFGFLFGYCRTQEEIRGYVGNDSESDSDDDTPLDWGKVDLSLAENNDEMKSTENPNDEIKKEEKETQRTTPVSIIKYLITIRKETNDFIKEKGKEIVLAIMDWYHKNELQKSEFGKNRKKEISSLFDFDFIRGKSSLFTILTNSFLCILNLTGDLEITIHWANKQISDEVYHLFSLTIIKLIFFQLLPPIILDIFREIFAKENSLFSRLNSFSEVQV
jgi:hypothetical protein